LALGVKEQPIASAKPAAVPPLALRTLSASMQRYLMVVGLFTLARASETFVLLLGHERGATVVELLLLWAALNFAKASASTLGGRVADRISRGTVVAISWSALACAFALLAVLPSQQALWLITIAYGFFAGFGEGAERAVISDFAAEHERGTAFGWYN